MATADQRGEPVMTWFARLLLFIAGPIAAWFVARDAANFGVVQMIVAMLLIVAFVGLAAFWPARWKRNGGRD
jgi:ABC-type phosphate transport system auxiliary subunit